MEFELNDVVMIVNVENKRVVYIETISCSYGGMFSTSNFNISKNLEVTHCNRSNDEEEYEIAKVWRFNKEKDDLVIIYPEREEEEPKKQDLFVKNDKEHELTIHDIKLADVPWDKHHKVLQENDELREVVVNQAKEINRLKKGK